MTVLHTEEVIEIAHEDRDISAAFRGGGFQVAIGHNYLGAEGYERWTDIDLTLDEAAAFRDWLTSCLAGMSWC